MLLTAEHQRKRMLIPKAIPVFSHTKPEISTCAIFPFTHHLNIRWHSGEEVQQLVVADHVRVAQLLGKLVHTCRNE